MLSCIAIGVALLALSSGVRGDEESTKNATLDWATPVLNALMCPLTKDPWDCGRQQAGRLIDVALADVAQTKQDIKDAADADLVDRIAHRAFSESELPAKEKPSAVMTTLDSYVTNSILSFMGRNSQSQPEHMKKRRKPHQHGHDSTVTSDPHHVDESHQHEAKPHSDHHQHEEEEEEDDDDDDEDDELEQFVGHHIVGQHHVGGVGHRRPHKGGLGGHHKPIHHKYGRDLGVTRGKKKRKFKKAMLKLVLLAAVLKVKLEFFLKVLATHLQIKFFIIALLGLLLNAAKFWLDLKKGHSPQKVIYYEHAQHQHHYDDHGDDGWGGGGGYWKRSFASDDAVDAVDDDAGAFEERAAMQAYRQSRLVSVAATAQSAQEMAYSRQKPAPV